MDRLCGPFMWTTYVDRLCGPLMRTTYVDRLYLVQCLRSWIFEIQQYNVEYLKNGAR